MLYRCATSFLSLASGCLDFLLLGLSLGSEGVDIVGFPGGSDNSALKMSFMADYTLSRLLTLSAYYERQTNKPLLSSNSYPTTTHDFGLSMKFSLTR